MNTMTCDLQENVQDLEQKWNLDLKPVEQANRWLCYWETKQRADDFYSPSSL